MARPLSEQHWQLFEHLYLHCPPPLQPNKFLEFWEVSYSQLGQLAGVSRSTIEHWMSDPAAASHRESSLMHQRRLSAIDRLFRNVDRIPPDLIKIWCDSE